MVGGVAEAVGVAGDGLDHSVGALGAGVGDSGADECEDLGPPGLHGGGQTLEFGQVSVRAAAVETVKQCGEAFTVRLGAGQRE